LDKYCSQPVKFKLNYAISPEKTTASGRDFSVWLGELSPDVNDYHLYETFACRYPSIRTAKGNNESLKLYYYHTYLKIVFINSIFTVIVV